jgi:diaminopimelate epimerase
MGDGNSLRLVCENMPNTGKSVQVFAVPYTKFHGLGNDFLVVRDRVLSRSLTDLVRAMLNRHSGVGADGLLLLLKAHTRGHDARVRFFNADGSEAEMSGNGIRCAGAFLLRGKRKKKLLKIETLAGVKTLEVVSAGRGDWLFRVGMGVPILEPSKIPFTAGDSSTPVLGFQLRTAHGVLPVTVTSMGNPHCSILVADFAALEWREVGREIETHELFPNRTNVEFVKLISKNEIEVRYWERGVGHTQSSGTGSCAAAVATILNGLTERRVRVHTEAGTLQVDWQPNGEVSLTGPVVEIAKGVYYFRQEKRW